MKVLYKTQVNASGDGRNGLVKSDDGLLELGLAMPASLGGTGKATNPEQLFAAGYAACFHSALRLVAKGKFDVTDSEINAEVSLGQSETGGFALAVALSARLPKLSQEEAQQLLEAAHQVCPYSNATRGNIPVTLTVKED